MPMYNLIEYGDNYSDTSGSLWQFKRDEIEGNVDLTANNSSSFKCKLNFSFIKLKWYENCILSNLVGNSTFTITDAKLYVPIVTLSSEDNAKLSKLLTEGFKRLVYWNKYKIIPNKTYENGNIKELLDSSCQELKDYLFLLIEIEVVLIELQLLLTEDIFSQELK